MVFWGKFFEKSKNFIVNLIKKPKNIQLCAGCLWICKKSTKKVKKILKFLKIVVDMAFAGVVR